MKGVLRVAAAVPPVHLGNVEENVACHLDMIRQAKDEHAALILFPELSLTGATCGDLFHQQSLLDAVIRGLKTMAACIPEGITAVVGAPLAADGGVYNCAVAISHEAGVLHVQPKVYPWGEEHIFSSGAGVEEILLRALQDERGVVLMDNDCLLVSEDGVCFGLEVGSDWLAPIAPGAYKALNGADVLLHLAAMPEVAGGAQRWRDAACQQSARCLCGYVSAFAGMGESSMDGVYGGRIMAACCGEMLQEHLGFAHSCLMTVDMDIDHIRARRMRHGFAEAAKACRKNMREACCPAVYLPEDIVPELQVSPSPFVPREENARTRRCMEVFDIQSHALARRLQVTGGKAVVGVSGGLDSTLALLVAARAMDVLGLPRSNILGVTMPCFGTTDWTHHSAVELMTTLGVSQKEVPIHEAVRLHFRDIGHNEADHSVTYENVQARERTQVLMDLANSFGGIVLGTGDLSEIALGWCTYNADHMSMYGVNAGVPKTLVRWVVQTIAALPDFSASAQVLKRILSTPISPELLPPDEAGSIAQQTEALVGPYALHDFFLYHVVRNGFAPGKIYDLCRLAFQGEYDDATILKWLKNFYRRFFSQQFKRNCTPDGAKVGSVSLSPRGDWHMPSDAQAALWLKECEGL